MRTIQEAVAQAPGGSTILVCPGTYRYTVEITGAVKDGLKLIATGRQGRVILQGDYTERDGFHNLVSMNARHVRRIKRILPVKALAIPQESGGQNPGD